MSIFTLQIHPVIFELETLSRWANFTNSHKMLIHNML